MRDSEIDESVQIDRATQKGFLYLQGHVERVYLVPQPIAPSMWMSLYILAFGANGICRKRNGRVALAFIPSDDDHFCVEVRGDEERLVDEVHELVDAFGRDPEGMAPVILESRYPAMQRAAAPDHDEILEGLYQVAEVKLGPSVVAVFEHELHDRSRSGPMDEQHSPEMEYWANYWGLSGKRVRLN